MRLLMWLAARGAEMPAVIACSQTEALRRPAVQLLEMITWYYVFLSSLRKEQAMEKEHFPGKIAFSDLSMKGRI